MSTDKQGDCCESAGLLPGSSSRARTDAKNVFGSPAKASAWMVRPNRMLGGQRPIEVAETVEGADAVERVLERIGHGLAA
ncbi:MbcA/ParS/Xre antitoxin family protein [Phenylobacterium sp.]|uniref:MbcA/ParS/Xre antitoxin family protein n=1 Tax=Phenylobacterium sp. TaxID=1871053 RepID=UPI001208C646|nr:MAG: DUF2384 domain-containing protein [Phenylobacterium sp.]